jgi:hypothetical protein
MLIYRKSWERLFRPWFSPREDRAVLGHVVVRRMKYLDTYTGWFLFGVVPIYVSRDRAPLAELRIQG